jgi:hypothetical protein
MSDFSSSKNIKGEKNNDDDGLEVGGRGFVELVTRMIM